MSRPDRRQPWLKTNRVLYYSMAVLSVAVAIIAAELVTRLLQAEAIALLMLCAVIVAAWLGGFGPALLAITLTLLAFHYYLVPPFICVETKSISCRYFGSTASDPVFHCLSLCRIHRFGAEKDNRGSPAF
jgi:K+-sensing histidine kinase KdpD